MIKKKGERVARIITGFSWMNNDRKRDKVGGREYTACAAYRKALDRSNGNGQGRRYISCGIWACESRERIRPGPRTVQHICGKDHGERDPHGAEEAQQKEQGNAS